MICNLSPINFFKTFTLIYLFKMQPIANLVWQNFIIAKSGCYMENVDSRMSPDLSRGTGKSIGGDLDVDDKGSEQRRFEPVQSLHHGSVGYQPMCT
jgi:hypothetical protein